MSTRSIINRSYCHSDGYPDWNGRRLLEFYNTQEKVDKLSKFPYLSGIDKKGKPFWYERTHEGDEKVSRIPQHARETPFYTDEEVEDAIKGKDFQIEYVYQWENGEWWIVNCRETKMKRRKEKLEEVVSALPIEEYDPGDDPLRKALYGEG